MSRRLVPLTTVVALVFFSAVGGVGCKKKAKDDAAGGSSSSSSSAAAPRKNVTEDEKANAYIECSNKFASRAYEAKDRYLSWVDAKKGVTGKEKIVYGTYKLNGDVAKDCRAKIDAVKNGPSMPELEQAGEHLTVALETLAPLLVEASEYYGKQGYKQDGFAKGKELHPKLMAAFDAFTAADDEMGVQLGAMEDKRLEQQLAELKTHPDQIPYLHTLVIFTGKKLVGMASGVDDITTIDAAAFEAALIEYANAVDGLAAYAKAHRNQGGDQVLGFATGAAVGVAKQGGLLLKRIKDKQPWSSGDKVMINGGNPGMVDGHPAAVVRAYNDMINASNRL